MGFSGIITTILGKSATIARDTGREIRVHHSKSLPLLIIGERLFFNPGLFNTQLRITHIIQLVMSYLCANSSFYHQLGHRPAVQRVPAAGGLNK